MTGHPNIILIITDQQRFDAMGCHGNRACPTPNLDRLASRSVDFTRGYCPLPLCSPSRASLMTGRTPVAHRVLTNEALPEDAVTFAELLADAGYACALSGKWHLSDDDLQPQRGFTRWVNHRGGWREHLESKGISYAHAAGGMRRFSYSGNDPAPPHQGPSVVAEDDMMVASVTRHARRMLSELRDEQPFFLKYSIFEPHGPIEVPEPYYSQLDPSRVPLPDNFEESYAGKPDYLRELRGRQFGEHLDETGWRMMRAVYYQLVSLIDHQIGLFLNDLEAHGLFEDALIVFVSDHGDMTGSHHLCYKGCHFYEEVMRVPYLIHYPGQTDGRTCDGIVAMEDIAPTILEYAGVAVPDSMHGTTLAGVGRGEPSPRDAAFAMRHNDPAATGCGRMIVTGRWKYVWHPSDCDQLYDLHNDPGEQVGLAHDPTYVSVAADLRRQLRDWMASVSDPLVGMLAP